jgi:hypothetical protein
VADAEEVSQRDVDTGSFFAVVIDAETDEARPGVFVIGDSEPDVSDDAGTGEIRHDESFAGHDALAIVIAADEGVFTGGAVGREGFEAGEIGEVLGESAATEDSEQ